MGCAAGRAELPAQAKPWLWHEIMFGCLSLAVSPRERGSAHTRALLPLRVRMLPPSPFSSAQTLSLPSSVGTEMARGLLPCHGGKNAGVFALGSRVQRGEMLCAGMFCADWPAWASPASLAGLRQMLERSEVLHTFTSPSPQMLS